MFDYRLEHITSLTFRLTEPEVIGPVPEGIRANVYVISAEATGPKLSGKFRLGGGDWLTLRRDGVAVLDVRTTLETHDGALIFIAYPGIMDFGETGYEDFLQGRLPPNGSPLRVSPRFSTSHPNYLWVNRIHCLGIGQAFLDRMEVAYDFYAVR